MLNLRVYFYFLDCLVIIVCVCYRHLPKLAELLTSADVELRIAAGETMALLYELARSHNEVRNKTRIFRNSNIVNKYYSS